MTTEAGKRLLEQLAYDWDPSGFLPGDYLSRYERDVAAIEAEAVAKAYGSRSDARLQRDIDMVNAATEAVVAAERQRIANGMLELLRDRRSTP